MGMGTADPVPVGTGKEVPPVGKIPVGRGVIVVEGVGFTGGTELVGWETGGVHGGSDTVSEGIIGMVKDGLKDGVEGVDEGVDDGVEEGVKEGVIEGIPDGVSEDWSLVNKRKLDH